MNRFLLAVAIELAVVAAGFVLLPASATAQVRAPSCSAMIGREPVAAHGSSASAIAIDKNARVPISLTSNAALGSVDVTVAAGPGPLHTTVHPPSAQSLARAASWSDTISVADYARFGLGLYEVTLHSGSGVCNLHFWVKVTGASPVTTPMGGGATAGLVLGIVAQTAGVLRGARGRGGLLLAALPGLLTGLSACVLSQQAGVTPITPASLLMWTFPPVSIGAVLQTGASALMGSRASSRVEITRDTSEIVIDGRSVSREEIERALGRTGDQVTTGMGEEAGGAGTGRGEATGAAGTTAAEEVPDPPRTPYALIDCADAVVAGTEFGVTVGLAPEAVAGVSGGQLVRPESSVGNYVLTVQVVAEGFLLHDGETWRHNLPVTADDAYPTFQLHLTALPQDEPVRARAIQAIYSVNGQSMGLGVRSIAVVRGAELLASAPAREPVAPASISIPTNEPAADLTVRIQRGDSESGGRLLWTFDTPHTGIDLPDEARTTDIGDEPEKFARQLIDGVGLRDGQAGLKAYLIGAGRTIADHMPVAFWSLLAQTAKPALAAGRQPSVFILSEEPYIPWELATVEPAIVPDAGVPPFLGAQANVGRWVLGHRRPALPPPFAVEVTSMAVVSGVYNLQGWERLVEAEAEAGALEKTYGAAAVLATTADVLNCLGGVPPAQALHFAVHGVYDPAAVLNGIVLTDGLPLDPLQVKGSTLSASPFVFLNACQVGNGNRVLGDYGGMAEAFLYAGAAGVVAPLWSIDDVQAREIALRFYEQAFAGAPPADVLRRERGAFHGVDPAQSATCLAYVWYGHPSFKLGRGDATRTPGA